MLNEDIKKAIAANLSAEVGDALKGELQSLENLRISYETLELNHKKLIAERDELKSLVATNDGLTARESAVFAKEQGLALRGGLITLREAHAVEKVDLMRGVVGDVFKNRKIVTDHSIFGSIPLTDSNGYQSMQPFNATLTAEDKD